jgi:hypothetical protein
VAAKIARSVPIGWRSRPPTSRRLGPTTASTLSLAEPVVTALLAYAVFGDVLTAPQLLGGALVPASTALSRASADVKACSGGVA